MALNVDECIAILDRIVKSKPEGYVYDSPECKYFEGFGPSCLVGHLLQEVVSRDVLNLIWNSDNTTKFSTLSRYSYMTEYFTFEADYLLDVVQSFQDDRLSWSDALRLGIEQTYDEFPRLKEEV